MIEFTLLARLAEWTIFPWIETTPYGWRFSWMMIVVLGVEL
ncbi:MAG: hypothetical protein QX191_05885 [Methylococcaceae bacterium]|jgi:hypothetical protein